MKMADGVTLWTVWMLTTLPCLTGEVTQIVGLTSPIGSPTPGVAVRDSVLPYAVIVTLMSIIALLLFFLVLWILFRHRECRFCHETMLEPHTVLDAEALRTGAWIPPPIVAIDLDEDDKETDAISPGSSVTKPPDVVPISVEASSRSEESAKHSKKKNLTLRKNMEENIEPKPGNFNKHSVSSFNTATEIQGTAATKSQKPIKRFKEPSSKMKKRAPEPVYAQVKKLNVPSAALNVLSTDVPSSSEPRPGRGSQNPVVNGINDLGGSEQAIRKHRRKSADRRILKSEESQMNIPVSRNDGQERRSSASSRASLSGRRTSDRVIYAELDFSKDVGLNIME